MTPVTQTVEAPAPTPAPDLRQLLKEAIEEAIAPLRAELTEVKTENVRLRSVQAFEAANQDAPLNNGVPQPRPDAAMSVTLATRPVRDSPEQYYHPVGALPSPGRD